MFGSRRARREQREQQLVQQAIQIFAERAEDPRRQAMADIVEHVLQRAGFAQAEIEPDGKGFAREGSVGFWMRVDSIGPGVLLDFVGGPRRGHNVMIRLYYHALLRAFGKIMGTAATQYLRMDRDTEWHTIFVLIPSDDLLRRLHAALARG